MNTTSKFLVTALMTVGLFALTAPAAAQTTGDQASLGHSDVAVEPAAVGEYQLSDLSPGDTTVLVGDNSIDISVNVTNTGTMLGNQTLSLSVENDSGSVVYSDQLSNVEIGVGNRSTQTFTGVPAGDFAPGNYTYTVESANDTVSANLSVETIAEITLQLLDEGTPLQDGDQIPLGTQPTVEVEATDTGGNTFDITGEYNTSNPAAGDLLIESSNGSVISVTSIFGVVLTQTQNQGTATVSAEYDAPTGNFSDDLNVTVGPPLIDNYDITIRNELAVGDIQNATVEEVWTNGTRFNVTDEFTLTSNDSSVASVTTAGGQYEIEGESLGTATLTANQTGTANETSMQVNVVEPEIAFNVTAGEGGAGLTGEIGRAHV